MNEKFPTPDNMSSPEKSLVERLTRTIKVGTVYLSLATYLMSCSANWKGFDEQTKEALKMDKSIEKIPVSDFEKIGTIIEKAKASRTSMLYENHNEKDGSFSLVEVDTVENSITYKNKSPIIDAYSKNTDKESGVGEEYYYVVDKETKTIYFSLDRKVFRKNEIVFDHNSLIDRSRKYADVTVEDELSLVADAETGIIIEANLDDHEIDFNRTSDDVPLSEFNNASNKGYQHYSVHRFDNRYGNSRGIYSKGAFKDGSGGTSFEIGEDGFAVGRRLIAKDTHNEFQNGLKNIESLILSQQK